MAKKRPFGVTLLALLAGAATIVALVHTLQMLHPVSYTHLDVYKRQGLYPSMIALDTQGLPYSWQPVLVPEAPYDESQPPGPTGLPAHIEILFGVTDPSQRQPGAPILYICLLYTSI